MKHKLSPAELEAASRVLQGLGHPLRLGVMQCLCDSEMTVGELQQTLGCSQSAMSQQLRILENQHIIRMRRQGRLKYCSVRNADLLQVFHCLKKHLDSYFRMEE